VSAGAGVPEPPPHVGPSTGDSRGAQGGGDAAGGWAPHDIPSAAELLDAVRGFLESDVLPATEGRVRFHARVAANVVAMVARELALGPALAAAHVARLQALGVATDAELAAAIRSGALDDRADEVRDAVRATVADKLAVANPGYLSGEGDAPHRSAEP
jgi:hypothetical protein